MKLAYLTLTLLVACQATAALGQSPPPAPMPTEFVEGERWEWRMSITPDVGAPSAPSREVVKSGAGHQFRNHRGNVYPLNVPFEAGPFFNTKSLSAWRQWPLEVGKSWKFEGEFQPAGPAQVRQTATVVAYEEVTVPAGRFMAYKVEYVGTATTPTQSWRRNETFWYAPALKADIKATIDTPAHQGLIELVSHRTAPK